MKALFIFYYVFSALVIVGAWEFDPKRKWYWKVLGAILSIVAAPGLFPFLVGMSIKENLFKK